MNPILLAGALALVQPGAMCSPNLPPPPVGQHWIACGLNGQPIAALDDSLWSGPSLDFKVSPPIHLPKLFWKDPQRFCDMAVMRAFELQSFITGLELSATITADGFTLTCTDGEPYKLTPSPETKHE